MEENLNRLKEILNNPPVRDELENFIKNGNIGFNSKMKYEIRLDRTNELLVQVKELTKTIWNQYGIEEQTIFLYIGLDTKFFPKMILRQNNNFPKMDIVTLIRDEASIERLDGKVIPSMYRSKIATPVTEFLNQNIELFPDATKNYISKKQKEIENSYNMESITDKFKVRVFEQMLEEQICDIKLENTLTKFLNIENEIVKIQSLWYFYNSLKNKYMETDNIKKLTDKIKVEIFKKIKIHIMLSKQSPKSIIDFEDLVSLFKENEELSKIMFERLLKTEIYLPFLAFFYLFTNDDTKITLLNDLWSEHIETTIDSNTINHNDCSVTIKTILLEESKRQFFSKNPRYMVAK